MAPEATTCGQNFARSAMPPEMIAGRHGGLVTAVTELADRRLLCEALYNLGLVALLQSRYGDLGTA